MSASFIVGVAGIDTNVKWAHLSKKGCTGKGVIIAIVDSGIERVHEGLMGKVDSIKSFNFFHNSSHSAPTLAVARHMPDHSAGTSCAAAAAVSVEPAAQKLTSVNGIRR